MCLQLHIVVPGRADFQAKFISRYWHVEYFSRYKPARCVDNTIEDDRCDSVTRTILAAFIRDFIPECTRDLHPAKISIRKLVKWKLGFVLYPISTWPIHKSVSRQSGIITNATFFSKTFHASIQRNCINSINCEIFWKYNNV